MGRASIKIHLGESHMSENTKSPYHEDTRIRLVITTSRVKKKKARDGRQLSADDSSQFRRRLMEYLERPYDQQQYVEFLQEVYQRKQKERHVETRQGVVKSYRAKDLAKAIAEFKGPQRVLFLLRGFIFWLQNLSHEGIFRPWRDELCLDTLRKM